MRVLPEMIDMEREPAKDENGEPYPGQNLYPYGLCICLEDEDLKKLDFEDDAEAGDIVHLHCFAKITTVSERDTDEGVKRRVELQITHISAEDESEENEEAEENEAPVVAKSSYKDFYK